MILIRLPILLLGQHFGPSRRACRRALAEVYLRWALFADAGFVLTDVHGLAEAIKQAAREAQIDPTRRRAER